jgi:hypothetical protein
MKKEKRKRLELSLEYSDTSEMVMALQKVISELRNPRNTYQRKLYMTSILEYSVSTVKEFNYREEIINGQLVMVIPSKMNDDEKV